MPNISEIRSGNVTYDLKDKRVDDLKSALSVLSIVPKLRDGSVANDQNVNYVSVANIIPIKNAKCGNIIIKRQLSANADHYLVRLSAYSIAEGKTGYGTGDSRNVTDFQTIYNKANYKDKLSIMFGNPRNLGWAFDITEIDANGNYIPLRVTDFVDGDVVVTLSEDNSDFIPIATPTAEVLDALIANYDVGFNHFTGKYYDGLYPLNDVSPLTFDLRHDGSICVIVPVGTTGHLRYRSNQLAMYVYSYDSNLNFIKRSNENVYAIDFVQNGYVIFRYLPANFNANTLMIAYTDETSGATSNTWDSLFPGKVYEPYTLIPKSAYELTEDGFIERIRAVPGVVISTDAVTDDKVATFTATNATKTWARLSLKCKPMTAYLLEFYGRCDYVDYSADFTHGSMLIIEFYDANGTQIGTKYNSSVLGVGGRRYHRCGAVSPYGAAEIRLRVVTRIDGSMDISKVRLRPVYGYQGRSANGVEFDCHLGCNFTAPRNTMPSFEQAKIAGYNTVICNVKFTSDNVPVVIHDQTIDATSDGTGYVSSYTYEQLQEFDFGAWFNAAYTGTKIPTLEEVLTYISANGMRPAISLHGDQTNEQLDVVASIFAKHCAGKCLIKSFSFDTVQYMYNKLGKMGEYVWDKPSSNDINAANVTAMVNAFPDVTSYIEIDANYITAEGVALAHAQGIRVGAYNLYDTAQLRQVVMMGVDKITMDFFSDVVVPVT